MAAEKAGEVAGALNGGMTGFRVCVIAGLIAALSACTRAPADDALTADLQGLLESNFAPGLLEVASARRANDFPFVLPGAEVDVRYAAQLRLKRDHRFGAWDQINIGTLALLLNARPQDIHGIKPAGNTAGDVIGIQGRLAYLAKDGALKPDTRPPAAAEERARGLVLVADLREAVKRRWAAITDSVVTSETAVAVDEWRRTRRAIAGRTARMEGGYAIATDRKNTVYWTLGRAAADTARELDVPFANVAADSPQEALDFLRSGRVSAAVLRNTQAGLASAGAPPFTASGPYRLMALAALYPEPVHVIVKDDSPFGSPADLFGKHVGVAGTARVDAVEAEAMLRGHGVPLSALAAPLTLVPVAEAFEQLEAGAFDALVMTAPLPNAPLRAFAARRPIRLLPFDSDAIAFMTSGVANFVAITIPGRTYPGQARPLAAVAAVTMLVSVETVPTKEAAGLIELLLARVNYLKHGNLPGAMISTADARRPMTLPWHPGATGFFEPSAPAKE